MDPNLSSYTSVNTFIVALPTIGQEMDSYYMSSVTAKVTIFQLIPPLWTLNREKVDRKSVFIHRKYIGKPYL